MVTGNNKTVVVLMATYNDWKSIQELLPRVDAELSALDLRGKVVIIDDGSTDIDCKDQISELSLTSISVVECVNLYRNHGHQRAYAIGIAYCSENHSLDYLIIMDSDQEDDPKYIPALIEACDRGEGRQIIFSERTKRSEGLIFGFFYIMYKRLYQVLTGISITFGNYSVVPKGLVRRLANVAELWSHYPSSVLRAKLPYSSIPSVRAKRVHGETRMGWVSLLLHGLSGFSVHAEIVGVRVLLMAVVAALFVGVMVVVILAIKAFTTLAIIGWTSQIISLLIVMLFQLFITMVMMVFLVVTARQQAAMIPSVVYRQFIDSVQQLFPK